jgi:hypothetical protein
MNASTQIQLNEADIVQMLDNSQALFDQALKDVSAGQGWWPGFSL